MCYDSTMARNGKLYFALINMKEGRKIDLSGANLNKCVELLLDTATSGVEVFISHLRSTRRLRHGGTAVFS